MAVRSVVEKSTHTGSHQPPLSEEERDRRLNLIIDNAEHFETFLRFVERQDKGEGGDPSERVIPQHAQSRNGDRGTHNRSQMGESRSRHSERDGQSLRSSQKRRLEGDRLRRSPRHVRRSPRSERRDRSPEDRSRRRRRSPSIDMVPDHRLKAAVDQYLRREEEEDPTADPFTPEIRGAAFPRGYRGAAGLNPYNGTTDPRGHLKTAVSQMNALRLSDANKCLVFATTLQGAALNWYIGLPPNSVRSFREFSELFLSSFLGSRTFDKPTSYLMTIRQKEGETLQEYVRRFNNEAMSVRHKEDNIMLAALVGGLRSGYFSREMTMYNPRTYREALDRLSLFIKAEQAEKSKFESHRTGKSEGGAAGKAGKSRDAAPVSTSSEGEALTRLPKSEQLEATS